MQKEGMIFFFNFVLIPADPIFYYTQEFISKAKPSIKTS